MNKRLLGIPILVIFPLCCFALSNFNFTIYNKTSETSTLTVNSEKHGELHCNGKGYKTGDSFTIDANNSVSCSVTHENNHRNIYFTLTDNADPKFRGALCQFQVNNSGLVIYQDGTNPQSQCFQDFCISENTNLLIGIGQNSSSCTNE